VQREAAPEEEEIQTKPLGNSTIQREEMPEEKEEIQTKPLNTSIQRDILQEEEEVQTKPSLQRATDGSFQAGGNIESQLNNSKGGGNPLGDEVRGFMEPRFGADFSSVRVHTGDNAVQMNRELGAQAFTHGSDVYFGAGKAPGNNELTAHELTHVMQQTGRTQLMQNPVSSVQMKCSACEAEEVGVQRSLEVLPALQLIQRRVVCDPSNSEACWEEPDPEPLTSNVNDTSTPYSAEPKATINRGEYSSNIKHPDSTKVEQALTDQSSQDFNNPSKGIPFLSLNLPNNSASNVSGETAVNDPTKTPFLDIPTNNPKQQNLIEANAEYSRSMNPAPVADYAVKPTGGYVFGGVHGHRGIFEGEALGIAGYNKDQGAYTGGLLEGGISVGPYSRSIGFEGVAAYNSEKGVHSHGEPLEFNSVSIGRFSFGTVEASSLPFASGDISAPALGTTPSSGKGQKSVFGSVNIGDNGVVGAGVDFNYCRSGECSELPAIQRRPEDQPGNRYVTPPIYEDAREDISAVGSIGINERGKFAKGTLDIGHGEPLEYSPEDKKEPLQSHLRPKNCPPARWNPVWDSCCPKGQIKDPDSPNCVRDFSSPQPFQPRQYLKLESPSKGDYPLPNDDSSYV
jgi:hypothetical protein